MVVSDLKLIAELLNNRNDKRIQIIIFDTLFKNLLVLCVLLYRSLQY